ncbi:mechanosensitive ion channel [Puteibacter caeruleilacunae]|nr:mechanosensitive ion channel [Puteibacter caeruleilacunae]
MEDFISQNLGITPYYQWKIIISIVIIVVLSFIRFLILRIVWKRTDDIRTRYLWKTGLAYSIPFIGVVLIIAVWMDAVGDLGAFLGLFAAGLAIAMKDPLTNIAGWLFIIMRKPFTVGDRIQIGEHSGDVIDMRLFQFTILEIGNWVEADQSTGRIIHIPNGKVFIDTQANYSAGFQYIWNEVPITITFESDWQQAKELLTKIINDEALHLSPKAEERIKEASKKFLIMYSHLTPIVYTSVKENGVVLTVRYLTDPKHRRSTEHVIWERVLKEFNACPSIHFAYPTQRFVDFPESIGKK